MLQIVFAIAVAIAVLRIPRQQLDQLFVVRPRPDASDVAGRTAYVVLGGSGAIELEDEVVPLRRSDVVRVAPQVVRGFEAGPDGLEILAVGPTSPRVETGFGRPTAGQSPEPMSPEKKPVNWRGWGVGILIALALIVCLQNSQEVSVEVLTANFSAPLIVVLLIAIAVGA